MPDTVTSVETQDDAATEVTAGPDDGDVEPGANRFELPNQADIRVAAEIQQQCNAALEASGDVRIDCGAVERIDAAVLQCIASLAKSLDESSRHLELADRSEPFHGRS